LLAFSTLGIVYGDIGTSPLYVWASLFPEGAPVGTDGAVDERVVLGCASSIVWAITGIGTQSPSPPPAQPAAHWLALPCAASA
jgi:K+ transporter